VPDATGLELLARELRETDPDSVSDTEFFREKAALHVPPNAILGVLEFLRGKGFRALMSVHGLDYYPEEPRLGVQYELLDMTEVDASRSSCASRPTIRTSTPPRPRGRPPTTRSARSTTCSA